MLARLVDEGFAADRHVHYPRNHGRVAVAVTFRAEASAAATVRVRVSGSAAVTVEGTPLEAAADENTCRRVAVHGSGESGSRSSAATARCRRSPSRPTPRSAHGSRASRAAHGSRSGPESAATGRRTSMRSGRSTSSPAVVTARCSMSARPCSDGPSSRPARGRSSRVARARRRRLPTGPRTRRVTISSSCRAAVGRRGTDWASGTWPCVRMPHPTKWRCRHPFPRSTDPGRSRAPTTGSPASGRPRSTPSGCACRA